MTRSKVIGGQIVIVILVNLFQILFEQVRFNYNQTWIIGTLRCTMVNLFQIAPVRTGSLQL